MSTLINPDEISSEFLDNEKVSNSLIPMGMTSEILSEKF